MQQKRLQYFWLPLLTLCVLGLRCQTEKTTDYFVFHGGAEAVGGSCIELVLSGYHYLIDIGAQYSDEPDTGDTSDTQFTSCEKFKALYEQNRRFRFDPAHIHAVFLTHAHMDHIGRLLDLYECGFRGKVYSTQATREMAAVMLQNVARYRNCDRNWYWTEWASKKGKDYVTAHWHNCHYGQRIKRKQHFQGNLCNLTKHVKYHLRLSVNPCRDCAAVEIAGIMRLFVDVDFDTPLHVNGNTITFVPTGHIPGAAAILFQTAGQGKRILFSGDVGNDIQLLYEPPRELPAADWVIMEGTYGNKERKRNYDDQRDEFLSTVAQGLSEKKIIWIPAFALDRTQKVLHEIQLGIERGLLPKYCMIYVPSPTAFKITTLYSKWARQMNAKGLLKKSLVGKQLFPQFEKHWSEDIKRLNGPAIIITTSAMMDQAFSRTLLRDYLQRKDVLLLFVTYQDPSLPGGKLKSGALNLDIDGQRIPVKLTRKVFDCFSSHADARDIERVLSANRGSRILLNHGDAEALRRLQEKLSSVGFQHVEIAQTNITYIIR